MVDYSALLINVIITFDATNHTNEETNKPNVHNSRSFYFAFWNILKKEIQFTVSGLHAVHDADPFIIMVSIQYF